MPYAAFVYTSFSACFFLRCIYCANHDKKKLYYKDLKTTARYYFVVRLNTECLRHLPNEKAFLYIITVTNK